MVSQSTCKSPNPGGSSVVDPCMSLNDLPDSNCQEPAPLPDGIGEFDADILQPKLVGFVDPNCSLKLRKRGSIAGCMCVHRETNDVADTKNACAQCGCVEIPLHRMRNGNDTCMAVIQNMTSKRVPNTTAKRVPRTGCQSF